MKNYIHKTIMICAVSIFTTGWAQNGTVTDIDRNIYKTVQIGNQIWMAENLKVTHYRNGDFIGNITNNDQWKRQKRGAFCRYENKETNSNTYGLLYNWYAVNDYRGLAPEGWHVPSDEEWKELEMYLGISKSEADDDDWRGTDEGAKLKLTAGWNSKGNGTNQSGFSAYPGGFRFHYNGAFDYMGQLACFWTSTKYDHRHAWSRYLSAKRSDVLRTWEHRYYGYSVRCVKD